MDTIFVSSTFQDMQYERDAIQKKVFPRLNAIAHEYGQSVSFCDLRWGINTENMETEERNYKVLDVCLDEVIKSDNPMVVILGDRYGWIPPADLVRKIAGNNEMNLEDTEISATALEIEYGSFFLNKNTIFYFRSINGTPSDARFSSEDKLHLEKMKKLKEKIKKSNGNIIKTYSIDFNEDISKGISVFSEMIYQDLLESLLPKWKAFSEKTPLMKEAGIHWQFVNEKKALFLARKDQAVEIVNRIIDNQNLSVIKGDSGTGKSTIFGLIASELKQRKYNVIPIASGLTPNVTTAFDVLKHEVLTIESMLPEVAPQSDTEKTNFNIQDWIKRLDNACLSYSRTHENPLIIMLDAADQLLPDEYRDKLIFIPSVLNEKVKYLFTSLPEIEKYSDISYYLENMKQEDRKDVVNGILLRNHKEMSARVTDAVVLKNGNPLYLEFLMQRLLLMGRHDFEEIRKKGGSIDAITSRQLEIVNSLPSSIEEMCVKTFEEAANSFDNSFVEKVSQYIALSRYGLRDTDLAALIGESWNYLDFSLMTSLLRDNFLKREDGRYDFMHKCIRNALLSTIENKKQMHKDLFIMFNSLDNNDPVRKAEITYHAVLSEDIQQAQSVILSCISSNDSSALNQMAENLYYLCRNKHTNNVGLIIDEINKETMNPDFLSFFYDYCNPLFKTNVYDSREYIKLSKILINKFNLQISDVSKNSPLIINNLEIYKKTIESAKLTETTETVLAFTKDYYHFLEKSYKEGLCNDTDYSSQIYYFFFLSKDISEDSEWLDFLIEYADRLLNENITEKMPDGMEGPFLGCLGEIYTRKGDYENVKKFYLYDLESRKKAAEKNTGIEYKLLLSGAYSNVGSIYLHQNNCEEARKYYEKAQEIDLDCEHLFSLDINIKKSHYDMIFNLASCCFACGIQSKDKSLIKRAYSYNWECIEFLRIYYRETLNYSEIKQLYFHNLGQTLQKIIQDQFEENYLSDFKKHTEKILVEDSKIYISNDCSETVGMIERFYDGFCSVVLSLKDDDLLNWLDGIFQKNIIVPLHRQIDELGENEHTEKMNIYFNIAFWLFIWGKKSKIKSSLEQALDIDDNCIEELLLSSEESSIKHHHLGLILQRDSYCFRDLGEIEKAIKTIQGAINQFNLALAANPSDQIRQGLNSSLIHLKQYESIREKNGGSHYIRFKEEENGLICTIRNTAKNKDDSENSKSKPLPPLYTWRDSKGSHSGNLIIGLEKGYGECILPKNDQYYGEWKDDRPHGLGVKILHTGEVVSGKWKNGKIDLEMPKPLVDMYLSRYKKLGLTRS